MATAGLAFEIFIVFFVYGLAFFSMGLVMLMESGRSPGLAQARLLRLLAFFGLVHGFHEWLDVILMMRGWLGLQPPDYIAQVRLILLVVSFASLLFYGLLVLSPSSERIPRGTRRLLGGLLAGYILLTALSALQHPDGFTDWVQHGDALARYLVAVPGALLTALALLRQADQTSRRGRRQIANTLRLAALAFGLYGISQVVVPPVDFFPGSVLNTEVFHMVFGVPVQAIRAVMAILVTVGLMRAAQLVEIERQRTFLATQQERLDALEQVRLDLAERETLRRNLLRHTVMAQEEERSRIARELHDETAQYLTALSLDLATLRRHVGSRKEPASILDRLQHLSRLMGEGIYRLVHDLRPAQLDDLGLAAALQHLVDEGRAAGVDVQLTIDGTRQRLDPIIETVFFRVAQEALSNVIRHAYCSQAGINLCFSTEDVSLTVTDNGIGFVAERKQSGAHAWGLEGMRERADSVGGRLEIHSQPGAGTHVSLVVPIQNSLPFSRESRYETNQSHAGG